MGLDALADGPERDAAGHGQLTHLDMTSPQAIGGVE